MSQYPILADESIMAPKAHGTTESRVIDNLRYFLLFSSLFFLISFSFLLFLVLILFSFSSLLYCYIFRWGCDGRIGDNICSFNRHYAEPSGYFESKTSFLQEVDRDNTTTFYDSVSGKPLFIAPVGRTFDEFLAVRFIIFYLIYFLFILINSC